MSAEAAPHAAVGADCPSVRAAAVSLCNLSSKTNTTDSADIASLQEKHKRSAPVCSSTPAAGTTPRHSQVTPLALSHQYTNSGSKPGSDPAGPQVTPTALIGQENVQEQCLSANRWLRGLAEECIDAVYTPTKLQPNDDIQHGPQVLHLKFYDNLSLAAPSSMGC